MDTYLPPAVPALSGFLARKVIAAGVEGRQAIVEAMRAELAWAVARWHRTNAGIRGDVAQGIASSLLPHEKAASAALNCWGHLHPAEHRIRSIASTICARKKYGWDVSEQEADLRWYWTERRKAQTSFNAAVAVYHKERAKVME